MSNFHLSEDRDHIARQIGRDIIRSVWAEGAHAAIKRHAYKPAGDLADENMSPELTYCTVMEHRTEELPPAPGSSCHTFWCDICKISYTLHD